MTDTALPPPRRWYQFWKRTAVVGAPAEPLPEFLDDGKPPPKPFWRRWAFWWRAMLSTFVALFAWLTITAPLSKSLEPIVPPQITLLAANGEPIARNGAIVDRPVKAGTLPAHVKQAFIAIEDRRFYSHWGIDPRGLARAAWSNVAGSSGTQGGSTITQQFAKFTFLNSERSYSRKAREMLIAFWLEAWLTKDEILERYLSNVYFGDNVYGLRAASLYYFYRQPERLTLPQSIMLAGLVQAPSRLAPTHNYAAAEKRARLVLKSMVSAGFLDQAKANALQMPKLDVRRRQELPTGTYFADWVMPSARAAVENAHGEQSLKTTLDIRLQRAARTAIGRAGLGTAQAAIVAMKPDGQVVAMIGGQSYSASAFNRVSQARRQPGSTFKLFVYLAALQSGMSPDSIVDDSPITEGPYQPKNYGDSYRGKITLREAFAKSSNVATVRLFQQLGAWRIITLARNLGVASALANDNSLALGSSGTTLLELTSAYAAVAANKWPIVPYGIPKEEPGLYERWFGSENSFDANVHSGMLDMLNAVVNRGTGKAAALNIKSYGKTGTSQDNKDALFVGFAGDLVVGVWVGNDDNSPLKGVTGSGLPARIWRDFMGLAIKGAAPVPPAPKPRPKPAPVPEPGFNLPDLTNSTFPIGIDDAEVRTGDDPGIKVKADVLGAKVDLDISTDQLTITKGDDAPRNRQ